MVNVEQPGSRVCALSHSRPARPCPAASPAHAGRLCVRQRTDIDFDGRYLHVV